MNKEYYKDIISLCKKRGFIFQNSDIYGGIQGLYDYGPLGVELKNNIKKSWWDNIVYKNKNIFGLDSCIITHDATLTNSGHKKFLSDELVECKDCNHRMIDKDIINNKCTKCKSSKLSDKKKFNLMFAIKMNDKNEDNYIYLRPETAQGIFINFNNIINTTFKKLPFGIAQIGKSFRNEITTKHFIFKIKEFEQMELEYFVNPSEDEKYYQYWIESRKEWWIKQGIKEENIKLSSANEQELAHYSKATTDILYKFPHGYDEIEGIANRCDFDLKQHSKENNNTSNSNLRINNNNENLYPYIIEPSCGVDRAFFAIINESYVNEDNRIILKLKKHLAPIKLAIIPIVSNKNEFINKAYEIYYKLLEYNIGMIRVEISSNIGKLYKKNDEIGTPFCITIDYSTFEVKPESVTIRYRDTMKQIRINTNQLKYFILKEFNII